MKANARKKKQSAKAAVKPRRVYIENRSVASKKALPTDEAKEMVKRHERAGYGGSTR